MDDSFFGFDASVPLEEDGGRIAEPSEEEYDALNDETFGSAINGDWEEVHENLVRLTDDVVNGFSSNNSTGFVDNGHDNHKQLNTQSKPKQKRKNKQLSDSDLELNLSDMRLDDINMEDGDNMGSANNGDISFDQSVWSSHPERTLTQPRNALSWNMEGENFSNSFVQNPYAQQHNHHNNAEATAHFGLNNYVQQLSVPKISTLEDIEKSILNQQLLKQQQKQQSPHNQQQQIQGNDQRLHGNMQNLPRNANHMNLVQDQNQHNVLKKETITQQAPPGFAHQDDQRRELITHHVQKLEQEALQKMQQEHLQRLQQHNQLNITSNHNQIRPSAESPSNPLFPRYKEQMKMMSQQDEQRRELITQHLKKLDHETLQKLQQEHLQKLQQQQHQQLNVTANRPPIGIPMYIPQAVAPHMPPHPLISQPGGSHNFAYPYPRPIPAPHLPVALNNFAMHPSFAAMRVAAATTGVHNAGLIAAHQLPRLPPPPNPSILLSQQQQQHQNNSMFNVFNMRLVQEIQQNHPLLQNAIRQAQCQQSQPIMQQNIGNASGTLKTPPQHRGLGPFGNLPPDEFDEYSNLMSTRDKHWLIGIQLSQLNTETPFIDDYYYTVYKERKAVSSGKTQHSQAHKDNQLNHPLTQPKGHAQLILVQLGNKNGTRNGQQRERRSSDGSNILNSSKDDQKNLYIFTPLKFENSLGKLQYGSVTAPRKIIDADIMSIEESIENNSNSAAQSKSIGETSSLQSGFSNKLSTSLQRKTRDILLHIEYLYRIILKLEDLENPTALATILMKKKKESERIAAMEQLENAAKNSDDDTFNITLKNKFNYELEAKDALLGKLVSALSHEKVVAMMNIRKGKVLLRRIMPFLSDSDTRWNIWIAIFSSLQNVIRKDRHDADGLLYGLYPEFKNQITSANFDTIVKIALSISFVDKKAPDFFCSKFGISALVCLILQAENVLEAMNGAASDDKNTEIWRQFLIQVATSLDQTIQRETISAIIESDSIHPMMNHFGRFKNIKVDSLLDLVKEAKQQIN